MPVRTGRSSCSPAVIFHCTLDIDECALGTDLCDQNSYCNNTLGSYSCICNPGYSLNGNGRTCDGTCITIEVRHTYLKHANVDDPFSLQTSMSAIWRWTPAIMFVRTLLVHTYAHVEKATGWLTMELV